MVKNKLLRVSYATTRYGREEVKAVLDVLKDPTKIVAGIRVNEFEKKIAKLFGKKIGVMVNSGSSANLLALSALNLPKGSEIITPALTFSTTIAPIVQLGLIPAFTDVVAGTYVINVNQIEKLITKKTKAIMIPLLLGNIPDLSHLKKLADKYGLYLIEDSCDTLDGRFKGRPTGAYSDVSTTSFYASHLVTAAGGGGMVMFRDPVPARKALLMANWGRESTLYGAYEKSEELRKRFSENQKIFGQQYDGKFIFSEIGYNFQSTELEAAFGLVQLARLPGFTKQRQKNFNRLYSFFKKYEKFFVLPQVHPGAKVNWLAFPLTIRKNAPFSRLDLALYLEKNNIQTRPIFTGNVLRQPGFANIRKRVQGGGYPVADYIMQHGILVGCHHGMDNKHLKHLENSFKDFLRKHA